MGGRPQCVEGGHFLGDVRAHRIALQSLVLYLH